MVSGHCNGLIAIPRKSNHDRTLLFEGRLKSKFELKWVGIALKKIMTLCR